MAPADDLEPRTSIRPVPPVICSSPETNRFHLGITLDVVEPTHWRHASAIMLTDSLGGPAPGLRGAVRGTLLAQRDDGECRCQNQALVSGGSAAS